MFPLDSSHHSIYIEGFFGRAIPEFLGSEDPRWAHGGAIGFDLGEARKMRIHRNTPRFVVEVYHHRSTTKGASETPANATDAVGILQFVRYDLAPRSAVSPYIELGMGMQYADQRTVDLSGRLSSTPMIGLGLSFKNAKDTVYIGLRLLHISNAGLSGNNQGQNQILITSGIRF